jgi:hypothetical protein
MAVAVAAVSGGAWRGGRRQWPWVRQARVQSVVARASGPGRSCMHGGGGASSLFTEIN